MDFPEFDHLSLDDLRMMLQQTVASWRDSPAVADQDKDFFRRLSDAISEREKTFGKGPAGGAT